MITETKQELKIKANRVYRPLRESKERIKRLQGGAGSGKSIAVAQHILFERIMKQPGHRAFCFRKVGRTVRESIFRTYLDMIEEYDLRAEFKVNKSEFSLTFTPNGNFISCGGMDDREKVKSIKDPTVIWMEEATEFDREDFQQLNLRLRKKGLINEIILSYNPISKANWIYTDFDEKVAYPGHLYLKTTYQDNRFLHDDYTKELERLAEIDDNYYKIYTLGEWGEITKGRIYPEYIEVDEIPETDREIFGLDFGFSDPMALVRAVVIGRDLYVDEVYYERNKTTRNLIDSLPVLGIAHDDLIYCDDANPSKIEEIYDAGFQGAKASKKGKGSIIAGIDHLKSYRLHVTRRSTNIKRELELYKWHEDKHGNFMEKPIDRFNHAMDAMRYAVFTHYHKPPTVIDVGSWLDL
jgi:phage terminase large subunit